jgi:preprotein translocase subunit SecD
VIEKRLDAYGLPNYRVTPQGNGRIKVDLPGIIADPERLKALIIAEGRLELAHVISPPSPASVRTYESIEEAVASYGSGGTITPNRRVSTYDENGWSLNPKYVVLEEPAIVDGSELRDASAAPSGYGEDYLIRFSLNKAGADKFGAWTGSHINEYLAVVLNDEVRSIAFIRSQISDQGEISGRFTKLRAEDLALTLKAGAMPASVRYIEETTDK